MNITQQNKNIQSGLKRLQKELHRERTEQLLQASIEGRGTLATYGMNHKQFHINFCRFICLTKTVREQLEQYIDLALKNESGHYMDFDGDALALYIFCKNNVRKIEGVEVITDSDFNTVEIWFDSMHFEQYVGAQEVAFDHVVGGSGQTEVIEARDYLADHWQDRAKYFIMNNLQHANIEDDHIENLLN